ncbi:hypothetical protein AURDEDRAFT_183606 [Auricularia subglabra TFB-10046 SS5]|nr:hypothetical protein AURDEDRAFT_183606 [Auricularia subglabra TFB-10046 SS5]
MHSLSSLVEAQTAFVRDLAPVVHKLGGVSPSNTDMVVDRLTKYTRQLTSHLSTDAGIAEYIATREEHPVSDASASTSWTDMLREAVDAPGALSLAISKLNTLTNVHLRARQVEADIAARLSVPGAHNAGRPSRRVRRVAAPPRAIVAPSQGSLSPTHDAAPGPAYRPVSSRFWVDEAKRMFLERRSNWTLAELYAWAMQDDPRYGIAASELQHIFLAEDGAHGWTAYDVEMLHDVAPNIESLRIDMPLESQYSPARPFPRLERLIIDLHHGAMWAFTLISSTLDALRVDQVREVRFTNAGDAIVTRCTQLVVLPCACAVVDDGDGRYISFMDEQGFERHFSGSFVNAVSYISTTLILSTITRLALNDSMFQKELSVLFEGFPEGLQELTLWFGGPSSLNTKRLPVVLWRSSGGGRCLQLRRLVLTKTWPLAGERPGRLGSVSQSATTVYEFLCHLYGRELTMSDNVQVCLEGVELKHTDNTLYPFHICS